MTKTRKTLSVIDKAHLYCHQNGLNAVRCGTHQLLIESPKKDHTVLHVFTEEKPGLLSIASVAGKQVPIIQRPSVVMLMLNLSPLSVDRVSLTSSGHPSYRHVAKVSANKLTDAKIAELLSKSTLRLDELTRSRREKSS